MADAVLAVPRGVMQVTLARRVAPTHPYHCRRRGKLSCPGTARLSTTPLRRLFTGTLPAQWLPRWPVLVAAGYSLPPSLCPHAFFFWVPNGAEEEWLAAGEAGEREGKGQRGSPGLPLCAAWLVVPREADALPCATLDNIYYRFFQRPPCSFCFS